MITTRNRSTELRRTLAEIKCWDDKPDEVIVTTDGCTDDTLEMMAREFPEVSIIENPVNIGSVSSRDRMIRKAIGDLVFALDDDSYPEQSNCISIIKDAFVSSTKLAVLHFPQRSDEYPSSLSEDFGTFRKFTKSFPNSGAVIRRQFYLQLPGFVPDFFHMYEEPDFALQCFGEGLEVCYDTSISIRHHYSGKSRSELVNHHRHARNEMWSTMIRCPSILLPVMLAYRCVSQMRYAFKRGIIWVLQEPLWWLQAVKGIPMCIRRRKSVSLASYVRWLSAG